MGERLSITGENDAVNAIHPTKQKYTEIIRLTVSLSKYLKAQYNPNREAEPSKGNVAASDALSVSYCASSSSSSSEVEDGGVSPRAQACSSRRAREA